MHLTGPVHGEEHLSLFGYSALFPRIINGDDRRISEIVLNFWVNFITSGFVLITVNVDNLFLKYFC